MDSVEMKLESAKPEEVGLDPAGLKKAEKLLIGGIEAREYSCAVYLIARHGKVAASGAFGHLGEEDDPPAALDSIFDAASLTKPLATAPSLMALVEQRKLRMSRQVVDFFPERDLSHLSGVTVEHLATHTSGLPAWKDLYSSARSRDEVIEELLRVPLDNPPGEKHVYSCLGYILLGLVIERVSGMPLADLAAEKVFRPLGMADTGFNPPRNMDRVARTANSQCCDGALIGEVHDENALAMGGISGNAGLFSTAPDMAVFAQMMLNGGELDGVRILSRRSVKRMLTNRIDPAVGGQAYGLCVRPNGYLTFGEGFSDRVTGHTGYTGTSLLIDPAWDMFVILLTNRVYRGRDVPGFFTRRREFHDIVAASVTRRP